MKITNFRYIYSFYKPVSFIYFDFRYRSITFYGGTRSETDSAIRWRKRTSVTLEKDQKTSWPTVVGDWRDWTRQSDWTGLPFQCPLYLILHFILLLLLLPSSCVILSYFNIAVPMRKCSAEHSCPSSQFSIAILNATCSLRSTITMKTFWKWSDIKLNSKKKWSEEADY